MKGVRMVSYDIITSNTFLNLSAKQRLLYIHLLVNADDDGCVDSTIKCIRTIESSLDDLHTLIEVDLIRMVIDKNCVLYISDWLTQNTIYPSKKINSPYLDALLERYPDTEYVIPNTSDDEAKKDDRKGRKKQSAIQKNTTKNQEAKESSEKQVAVNVTDKQTSASLQTSSSTKTAFVQSSNSLNITKPNEITNPPLPPLANSNLSADEEEALNLILKCSLDRVPYDKKIMWARKHG